MPYVFVGKSQTVGGGTGDGGGNAIQFRHGPTTTTGSNHFTYLTASGAPHTLFITGNVVVSGTLEANTYRVNTVDTSEGSTIFGNSAGDAHQLTGTVYASADVHVGNDLLLRSDGSILKFGADNDVTFTHAGDGMNIAMAGACEFDSTGGSLLFGNAMASGQTLKLGNENAVQVTIAPHDTAASEKYSVVNTAGNTVNAIGLTASAGGIALKSGLDVTLEAGGGDILLTGSVYGNGKIQATGILNVSGTNDSDAKLELRYKSDTLGTKRARINFNSGSVNTATPDWSETVHPANYAKLVATSLGNVALYPALQYLDNAHLVSYGFRDRYGNKLNGASGYSYITVNASGNVGMGRDVYVNADSEKLLVDASGQTVHQSGLYIKGPEAGSQNADLNALFVSGTANTTGGNNSFLIRANCDSKISTGPVFFVSSSGQTNVQTDMASDYPFQVINDGNNANRHGIQIQAGADDASGQTFYINCNDGDGGNVGYIENNGGTFRLVDPSDKRLKKNIKNTKLKGLVTLGKIKVRDFELKKNNLPKTGFIAQELEKVYPPSVSKPAEGELDSSGNPRMMGVSYEALVPLLVKAVQELSTEVTELKKKLADS